MSIQIGRHIQAVLKADSTIRQAFGNRIYPVVIPQSAPQFPFIVYSLVGTGADHTKDGNAADNAQVSLVIVDEDYDHGITMANHIRYLLENRSASYPYMTVEDCEMTGYSEDWDTDLCSFVFVLNFNFNTQDL